MELNVRSKLKQILCKHRLNNLLVFRFFNCIFRYRASANPIDGHYKYTLKFFSQKKKKDNKL